MSEEQLLNTESTESVNTAPETTSAAPIESPAATNVELTNLLSDEYKGLSNLKDFKSADDLAKSYVELQRMVGNSVRIPAEDASPEAKQEFLNKIKDIDGVLIKGDESLYNKLGRPESADQYDIESLVKPEIAQIVPGLENEINDFKSIAHEVGLTSEQASKIAAMRLATLEAQSQQIEQNREQSLTELRRMWGDDFENRLASAKRVTQIYHEKYGSAVEELVNSPAGNNPALLNILSELASMYKEKNHEGMSGSHFGMTPEMALDKIAEKKSDKGFMEAYHDDRHPGHDLAIKELQRLYGLASSGKK